MIDDVFSSSLTWLEARIHASERKQKSKLPSTPEGSAPVFLEKPENKVITEGANDFIEAIVNGNPFPTVTWFKGARECMDGPKYMNEIDQESGVVGLVIKKAKPDDEAKYMIKISNPLGEEKVVFTVFVKCKHKNTHTPTA